MIKLITIEKELHFAEKYRQLALEYCNEKGSHWAKPKKEDMLAIFKKIGYPVKYYSGDRIYIEKYPAGKYSFEYYYEFNGMTPDIFIYIKKIGSKTEWPLQRYPPGFIAVSKKYFGKDATDLRGLILYATSLNDLENIFARLKPMLDELREVIIPYLEKDELDFTVNEDDY